MNNLDKQYQSLLQDILDNGVEKNTRNGKVLSVFGRTIRYKFKDGKFPLLTTKKMAWKSIVTELLWFLRGDTNIKFLVDNDCHIWDGDVYKNYVKNCERPLKAIENFISNIKNDDEFAKKWGDLGPIYGKQWRKWEVNEPKEILRTENVTWPYEPNPHTYQQRVGTFKIKQIDQIANLINELKTNPDSRRLMVSAWNPGELDQMVLPPCHYGFQVYTRELSDEERVKLYEQKTNTDTSLFPVLRETLEFHNIPSRAISLMWNQRSVDTFLGLPFNIASYGLLLEIIAKEVNMVPDELIGNLGDTHLYLNHIEQAKEQIGRELTVEERMDWWFKNRKPNRDVCDHVDELSPYAKGLHFDSAGVPKSTRDPFELPKLTINVNNKMRIGGGIFTYVNTDFTLDNYQSHPSIKAPLSN